MKKILIVIIITMSSCKLFNLNNYEDLSFKNKEKMEKVIGIAYNAKIGAVVETRDNDVFYIDGLDYWDSIYLNKVILVEGYLYIVQDTCTNKSLIHYPKIEGNLKILKNANYKLYP